MKNKSELLSLVKGLLGSRSISYDKRVIHPTRDWLFGLLLFFVVVILGGTYSAYQFVVYRNINVHEGSVNELNVKYNQTLVQSMITKYGAYKESYDALQNRTPVVEDGDAVGATPTEEVLIEEDLQGESDAVPVLDGG